MNNQTTLTTKNLTLISLGIVVIMLAISGWAWGQISADAQIPVHWGPDGQADGWGSKTQGLLMLPAVSAATALLLAVIPKLDPRAGNIARSGPAYFATAIAVMLFLLVIHIMAVLAALGYNINATPIVMGGLGLMFMVIGNFLGKISSNYMFGIRTPWTLASELSWNKTHRVGGKLFMAWGLFIMLGALLAPGESIMLLMVGGMLAIVAFTFGYSYWVFRTDPNAEAR